MIGSGDTRLSGENSANISRLSASSAHGCNADVLLQYTMQSRVKATVFCLFALAMVLVAHRLNVSQSQIPAPITVAANRFACVVAHAAAYPP